MMPNIVTGSRMVGLVNYLAGPGRSNEHTNQRVIAASEQIVSVVPGQQLNHETAMTLGHELDIPKAVFGAGRNGEYVFHASLSLPPDEGPLPDELWQKIAAEFVEKMEFNGGTRSSSAPCRWVAIHHGTSKGGNDHIHIAVSMVAEDGKKWLMRRPDGKPLLYKKESQRICDDLERKYGLRVVRGEHAERGYHPVEVKRAMAKGAPELDRDRLQRLIRAASTASVDEAEFVRRMRASGVSILPRFAEGGRDEVVGYSVALRATKGEEKPQRFAGGKIARDLTLTQLRKGWDVNEESTAAALAEWRAAAKGERPVTVGREARTPTAEEWKTVIAEVGALYERMKSIPLSDSGLWAQVARETSGAFAAWSLRTEATPGPLADASRALSRTAQLRRFPPRVERAPMPSAKGAGMLLMQTSVGPSTAAGHALLLAQLRNTMKAMHDMHRAAGRLQDAERVRVAAMDKLTIVRGDLQSLQARHVAATPAPSAASRWLDAAARVETEHEKLQRLVNQSFPDRDRDAAERSPAAAGAGPGGSENRAKDSAVVEDAELEQIQRLVSQSFPAAPTPTSRDSTAEQSKSAGRGGRDEDKGRSR